MMAKSVFITATGTDVGKTFVSALFVKKLRQMGINCGYYKPVLSGAVRSVDGSLYLGDAEYVIKISGLSCDAKNCVSYFYEEPVSPHLAANRCGDQILLDKLVKDYNDLRSRYDFLLVEGAGGVTCPLCFEANNKLLLPDVIKALGSEAIIVADAGLGTINSCVLTAEYAKSLGIKVLGFVLNNYDKNNFMHVDNRHLIEDLTGVSVLATVEKDACDIAISYDIVEKLVRES